MRKKLFAIVFAVVSAATALAQVEPIAAGLAYKDAVTIASPKDFVRGWAAINADDTVNAVVEIPAGSYQKWEVSAKTGVLAWEIKNGAPRIIKYLAYPANYGMICKTAATDGDTLDVIILGPMIARGSVVPVRVIGAMKFDDSGKADDKLIAVVPDTPYAQVASLAELNAKFPGASHILETWFYNYKGPGEMIFKGFVEFDGAAALLDAAVKAYKQ